MQKHLKKVGAAVGVGLASAGSFAAADYSALTTAVDFTAVGTAVIAGMAAMATVGVLIKGGSAILRKLGLKF